MYIFLSESIAGDQSLQVRALLDYGYRQIYKEAMPAIDKTKSGKPFFPSKPDIFFSLSHTEGNIICAISEHDVGIDIQKIKAIRENVKKRVCLPEELETLDFFSLWSLKESAIKLYGRFPGSYTSITFIRDRENIICSDTRIFSHLYYSLPDASIAVCSFKNDFPDEIFFVSPEKYLILS